MPIARIERIVGGVVRGWADRNANGKYVCHVSGSNIDPQEYSTLDEVADFLKRHPRGGVRMNPGWGKITKGIYIDGVPR